MTGTANDLNISEAGMVSFDGTSIFHGRTITGGAGISITNGSGISGDPTISLTGGSAAILKIIGNTGGAQSPDGSGNFNLLTANTTVKFAGTTNTETVDFNLSNLALGSSMPSALSAASNVGIGGSVGGVLNAPLQSVTSASGNVAIGWSCGGALNSGNNNVLIGQQAGSLLTTGIQNNAIGSTCLLNLTTGSNNTGNGQNSLAFLETGSQNTALGSGAGTAYNGAESSNILIKHTGITGESNTMRLGTPGSGSGQVNRAFLAGVTGVTVAASAPIAVDASGQLSSLGFGTATQVLTSNGAGSSPTWQAAATGTVTSVSGTANRITSTGGATPVIDISASYVGQTSITTLGTISTGVWNGTSVDLAHGGTNANLTASNGGIFYSTATAGAILSGTATAGQILRSGSSAAPAWSTATYPATAGTSGNVLTSDGTNFTSSAPAASSLITTYNASGSWTINSKSKTVRFLVWGGGGGGGSGRCGASSAAGGGGGGAGGGFYDMVFNASDLTGSPYTVTVGTGGTGGTSVNATTTNGNPGNPGNNSSVGSVVLATGGLGGGGGTNTGGPSGTSSNVTFSGLSTQSTAGTNGASAVASTGTNLVNNFATGGGGGSGYQSATARIGGAAGSITDQAGNILVAGGTAGANTGATAGNGNSPSGQSMSIGGTGGGGGGHNGVTTAGTGGNGAQPGGGGGGGAGQLNANPSGAGGNGGDGKVIIIEYF